jgi:hypothetical protein
MTIDRFASEVDSKLKSALTTVKSVLKKRHSQTEEGAELIKKIEEVTGKDRSLSHSECYEV